MSDEQPQPRAEWVFPEEKKSNKGRIWLIVGLVVAAVAIVVALLWIFLPHNSAAPTSSPSPSTSESATPTPTSSPSPTPTEPAPPSPEPTATTQPPVPDPDMSEFAETVRPRLDDAVRGLDLVTQLDGDGAAQIVDSLQIDAEWLSGAAAPNPIADEWSSRMSTYSTSLTKLRSAYENGTDSQKPLDDAMTALNEARALAGL